MVVCFSLHCLNILSQAVPCPSFFRRHFVSSWRIFNLNSSLYSAELVLTFHAGFMKNSPLIKKFAIDLHANNLRASRWCRIRALDARRGTHVASSDVTMLYQQLPDQHYGTHKGVKLITRLISHSGGWASASAGCCKVSTYIYILINSSFIVARWQQAMW